MAFDGQIDQAPDLNLAKLFGVDSSGRAGNMPSATFATSAQGTKADSAVQPAAIPNLIVVWLNSLPSTTDPVGAGLAIGQYYWNGGVLAQVQP
jgi:hypothetical protein